MTELFEKAKKEKKQEKEIVHSNINNYFHLFILKISSNSFNLFLSLSGKFFSSMMTFKIS